MGVINKLAGQTVLYGLSSVVPKFLNYLLVPFHTIIAFQPAQYGVVTELYAYFTFLNILLTYGMETGFFRFSSQEGSARVFGTSFLSLFFSSLLFMAAGILFSENLAAGLDYEGHANYFIWFALILGFDAMSAIPFALFRQQNRPLRFSFYKIFNVAVNLFFNLFFLWYAPAHQEKEWISWFYRPDWGVEYVFLSNLLASALVFLLLIPDILRQQLTFNGMIWRRMIRYSLPLMAGGLVGCINETLDRILLRHLLPDSVDPMAQLGIYGANVKMAVLMTLFIQMFRYAAEPFFFSQMNKADAKENMALVMKYFVLAGLLLFLGVALYIDIFKYFVGRAYWSGLGVVPILLLANLFLGIYFNLSIWFKINNMTQFGFYMASIGAAITLLVNFLFVPLYGYVASAWAHLLCYIIVSVITLLLGNRFYPIPYPLKRMAGYFAVALGVYVIASLFTIPSLPLNLLKNTLFFAIFALYAWKKEQFSLRLPFLTQRGTRAPGS